MRHTVRAYIEDRVKLMERTISPAWAACGLFGMFSLLMWVLVPPHLRSELLTLFIVLTIGTGYMTYSEWRDVKKAYGGRGFFEPLRKMEAAREAQIFARLKQHQVPEINREAQDALLVKVALEAVLHVSGEPRARKIADKSIRAKNFSSARLRLISDNARAEPRSAHIANIALTRL